MTTDTKWTVSQIKMLKGKKKFACLTAADYITAKLLDQAGIPLILVGDSLGMTVLGYDSTLPVTMEMMLHHTSAVSRAAKNSLVVADMPFLSFQVSIEKAIENAGSLLKEAGAGAVKIEGGAFRSDLIENLTRNGIPVLAHIGLTPQSVRQFGGYKMQGKTKREAEKLLSDAIAIEKAGAFAVVIECVPPLLAKKISSRLSIPTIGIGAGPDCDGQILVFTDLLGLTQGHIPSFAKQYANLSQIMLKAFQQFKNDVETNQFPLP
jgi:3-methyl-2-oxobutanoate hydroxymethyltransferase